MGTVNLKVFILILLVFLIYCSISISSPCFVYECKIFLNCFKNWNFNSLVSISSRLVSYWFCFDLAFLFKFFILYVSIYIKLLLKCQLTIDSYQDQACQVPYTGLCEWEGHSWLSHPQPRRNFQVIPTSKNSISPMECHCISTTLHHRTRAQEDLTKTKWTPLSFVLFVLFYFLDFFFWTFCFISLWLLFWFSFSWSFL